MKRKLSDKKIEKIIEMYAGGATVKSIVEKFGVTDRTIHEYIRSSDTPLRRVGNPKQVNLPPVSVLSEKYEDGEAIKDIAKGYGVSIETIRKRLGLKREGEYKSKIFSQENVEDILRRYENGESKRSIAKRYGASPSTISYCVSRQR